MLAPINSIKHYIQFENSAGSDATRRSIPIVHAVLDSVGPSDTQDVTEGAIVKAVFIELWNKSNAPSGTEQKFQFAIEKVPAGAAPLSFTDMNNLQAYQNKKNILYFTQGVIGDLTVQAIPVFRQWILLPKGKQRFGFDDDLTIALSTTGATNNSCGFATYKEYK